MGTSDVLGAGSSAAAARELTTVGKLSPSRPVGASAARGALRVLVVIPQLRTGGAEKQVVLLASELRARGHEVGVATFYPGGDLEAPLRAAGIPVFVVPKTSLVGWEVVAGLRRLLDTPGHAPCRPHHRAVRGSPLRM